MAKRPTGKPRIHPYVQPAGGWGALAATTRALAGQGILARGGATLLHMNQPTGFDCPGCAWPDPDHTSAFEFCENCSHDQYNTTLYSLSDRYRGVFNQRMVVFLSPEEMKRRGLGIGALVALETVSQDGVARRVEGFKVVP
jgi:anaerobic selenocysteine-containing dehydrogenase